MEATVTPRAGTAWFIPPAPPAELDFRAWLQERTPPGAPTVPVLALGARAQVHLPQVRPPAMPSSPPQGRKRRGFAPAFHAAYLHDVDGLSPRRLIASGLFDLVTERAARQHVRDGRLAAAWLGAWPWAVADGQALARNWWVDRHFALALQRWAVGELRLVGAGDAVHALEPRRYAAAARLPVA
jgi:hypothetical protein